MKPLYLIMSAFGSYAGEEAVDFEKLDHGIFLITGDTGAGKTTIFDAVTFALFGETTGQARDGGMMRSHYAAEDRETWVSLRFSHQNECYEITRSPQYSRLSRRKNKDGAYTLIQVPARARLILPDGREFPGNIRDVNQKIQEILGVDYHQFSQIAMIAQGDYLKLLHASSRERKEIFSRLFNTGIYRQVQLKLKDENNRLYGALEDNRKLIDHELGKIEVPAEENEPEWQTLRTSWESGTDNVREALGEMLRQTKQDRDRISARKKETAEQLSELTARFRQAEEVNRFFLQWDQEKKLLEQLLEKGQEQEQKKQQLTLGRKAERVRSQELLLTQRTAERQDGEKRLAILLESIRQTEENRVQAESRLRRITEQCESELPDLRQRLTRLEDILPLFTEWKKAEQARREAEKTEQTMAGQLEKLNIRLEELREKLAVLSARQEAMRLRAEQLPRQESELERSQKEEQQLLELKELFRKQLEQNKQLQEKQQELHRILDLCTLKNQEYDRKMRRFLSAQAGIMASGLEEGMPCPVCGSTEHPAKAALSGEQVSQADVEAAEQERRKAEQERDRISGETVRLQEVLRQLEERLSGQEAFLDAMLAPVYRDGRQESRDLMMEKLRTGLSMDAAEQFLGLPGNAAEQAMKLAAALRLHQEYLKQAEENVREAKQAAKTWEADQLTRTALEKQAAELETEQKQTTAYLQELQLHTVELRTGAETLKKRLSGKTEEEIRTECDTLQNRKNQLEREQISAQQQYDKLLHLEKEQGGSRIQAEENVRRALDAENQARIRMEEECAAQGFASEEAYHGALQPENRLNTWEQELASYEEALLRSRTVCEQYAGQLSGKQQVDTAAWKESIDGLQASQGQLEQEEIRLSGILERNTRSRATLEKLWTAREKLRKEYASIRKLYQTANGKVSGAVGLDFQTFVQRQYFERMIQAANRRLRIMTDSQFLLQCRQLDSLGKQGEVGLDLDVYSLVTDKVRDVRTLSGGESFLAALAMALGMADVIQNMAGNVQVDALFIDEGFGALDEESRLRAIRILQQLAGGKRLVGIVSHVTELKEQIERKLIVKKTEKGSQIQWQLEDV